MAEALNSGELEAFLARTAEDVEFTSLVAEAEGRTFRGHAGVRAWWETVLGAFQDPRWEVLDARGSGDRAVVKSRLTATLAETEVEAAPKRAYPSSSAATARRIVAFSSVWNGVIPTPTLEPEGRSAGTLRSYPRQFALPSPVWKGRRFIYRTPPLAAPRPEDHGCRSRGDASAGDSSAIAGGTLGVTHVAGEAVPLGVPPPQAPPRASAPRRAPTQAPARSPHASLLPSSRRARFRS